MAIEGLIEDAEQQLMPVMVMAAFSVVVVWILHLCGGGTLPPGAGVPGFDRVGDMHLD
jgi:hypothetical protein